MASTFSPSLRLELIGDGDQSGIWGQTTNNNLGGLIEQAIGGVVTISMVDANYTLTNFNGVVDEARNAVIVATGALSQQRNIIAPLVEKTYSIQNSTTGGFPVQIIGPSGTGVIVPNGATLSVYCDGTNYLPLATGSAGNFRVAGNFSVVGTTTLTGALSASTATFSGAISSVNPVFTGTPTAPTAAAGTNTTQIATTAFVQGVAGSLGTMSTQNANNVNITGGSINGTAIGAVTASTVRGTTGTFTGAMSAASLAGGASTGAGASGTWSINVTGNAGTANNPASGGSFITTSNIASQSVNFANSANSATNATFATNPASGGSFITSSNIGSQSVNFANSATNANNANTVGGFTPVQQGGGAGMLTNKVYIGWNGSRLLAQVDGSSQGIIRTTAQKLGLGISGELWVNVTGSRVANDTYTNSYSYPIMVAVSAVKSTGLNTQGSLEMIVNGAVISRTQARVGNNIDFSTVVLSANVIVPPGSTYRADLNGSTFLQIWQELY